MLAEEGVSIEVNLQTMEITDVSIDGEGSITWFKEEEGTGGIES
jgi:hypothetical protein